MDDLFRAVFIPLHNRESVTEYNIECIGMTNNNGKSELIWHTIPEAKWGPFEVRLIDMTRTAGIEVYINGQRRA
ncbi:unnamed protein product, partial [Mesorhabditis belari]|uniref:Galectin n=1 Tax=Mesorhabditis belari TaxID=2138241 RepID=A0AAF3F385_9BILA